MTAVVDRAADALLTPPWTPPGAPSAASPEHPSAEKKSAHDRERPVQAWFAFFGLVSGVWQFVARRPFYDDFPGFGRHWVDVDGRFNEHLLRDVGQGDLRVRRWWRS